MINVNSQYLFLYGTLRKAFRSPLHLKLRRYTRFVGEGCYQGRLYNITNYPGAVRSTTPGEFVHGEVYKIYHREKLFQFLDYYENARVQSTLGALSSEYVRALATIRMDNGGNITAWIYIYNGVIPMRKLITCGDYVQYIRTKKSTKAGYMPI